MDSLGPSARPAHLARYDVLGLRAEVRADSAEFLALLDRLNAGFRLPAAAAAAATGATGGTADASYLVRSGAKWEVAFSGPSGEERTLHPELLDALDHVEWHVCDQAIRRRNDLLHVHGAAIAAPGGSLLLPGKSGIGKTTFALALALRGRERGLRLLSDDVVFLHTDTWVPEAFPRAFHVHDDALPRLTPLGLRYEPEDVIDDHLCVRALGEWDHAPGPPLRYVVFPRLDPDGPLALEPITAAEATLELLRYSKNLKHQPRFGLDLAPALLTQAECHVLRRNDDLRAAADLVLELVAG